MTLTTAITAKAIGIGILSGTVAALCGVGGGVVMVPAFVSLLSLPQKTAVATSLAIIIPTALTATIQNARADLIEWKLAAVTAISSATLAYLGAGWLRNLSNATLTKLFGVILIAVGLQMLLRKA